MITIELYVNKSSGRECDYKDCKHLPKYFNKVLNTFYIKQGVTCLWVALPSTAFDAGELYCRDCLDRFYHDHKSILDSKLWVLT